MAAVARSRGPISIDKIVALRSSVLPLYLILRPDGRVTAADEVSEDGWDFLTTKMHGDKISFQSIHGNYLSAEDGMICTRRFCSDNERFTVERKDTQYAFRAATGHYLSMCEREPFVTLSSVCGETEVFHLFSLMMYGCNVGKQLETLEKTGAVMIDDLIDQDQLEALRRDVPEGVTNGHEARVSGLATRSQSFAELVSHPMVMQLALRILSSRLRLSALESCQTNADHVRKELEATTWHVVHPYSAVEFPGIIDPQVTFSAVWFLDELNATNSTWGWVRPPLADGAHLPKLPQLSSPQEVEATVRDYKQLTARQGSVWLYLGPVWMSNNMGAASFWKDYDAQTRYKHLSGQKEQGTFRALTDAQRAMQPREELCPTLLQATYVREYVVPSDPPVASEVVASFQSPMLQRLLA
mmetsp:Transcript_31409/g.73324  ORF Transcript_31409/g.73324 Transcript_31409/m.73324 type:complete len:413 (-) Transcript_31409:73-1311(-)|eukprot:CAMPEP_0178432068 /NCGR_PEP_ID=MMETSP0689_2-20121128/32187_1 /TAXON_ID=160604 /ORGANISM="Amphidinium massartii, Strain CS-259" /LENGTH=412 /DNA_ID=CAMNT_0020054029 /DNA_START=34 /DNA_END=1272 /DNA_ORIENTATION=-